MSDSYLKVFHLESVDSTSNEVTRKVKDGQKGSFCVLADQQTSGRGRLGRPWVGIDGNFFGSFYHELVSTKLEPSSLSIVAAVATAQALHECFGIHISIKWPNDLYLGSKKLGGILIECTGDLKNKWNLNIGLGININQTPSSEDLEYEATALSHYVNTQESNHQDTNLMVAKSFWKHWVFLSNCDWETIIKSGEPFGLSSETLWSHKETRGQWVQRDISTDGSLSLSELNGSDTCNITSAEHSFELLKSRHLIKHKKKLLLDVGNTAIKLAYADSTHSIHLLASFETMNDFLVSIDETFQTSFANCIFFVSNVRSNEFFEKLKSNLKERGFHSETIPKRWVRCRSSRYDQNSLGIDRRCLVEGYLLEHTEKAIIVSAGTATTIDIVDADRNHLGGWILPGLNTMMSSLKSKGTLLSQTPAHFNDLIIRDLNSIPVSTIQAMNYGCVLATRSTVESLSRNLDVSNVVVTGGLRDILSLEQWVIDSDLLFKGLNELSLEL